MAFCPNCGEPVVEGAAFCSNCGAPLKETPAETQQYDVPEPAPAVTPDYYADPQPATYNVRPVEPIPTGGLFAWAIFVILFCTIPGIVCLIKVRDINRATSVEEQQEKLETARKWLIGGTVLAVLNLINLVIQNNR